MKSPPNFHPEQLKFGHPKLEARCSASGLYFDEISYVSGLQMPMHTHNEAFLDLCLTGTIQDSWDKQTFLRGPSTLNFLPIGAPHASSFPEQVRTFQIIINAPWIERVRQIGPIVDTVAHYQNGPPTYLAVRMYREFQHRDNLTPLVLEGMLLELLAEMSRHSRSFAENDCPRWLRQTKDFLHAHFTESPSVDTIATAVGVHPSHLMRGFRKYHRCTVGDYIRRLRVEYACRMLSTSDAPPSQIAYDAGFADQSHFNRTFKNYTGMTPTEFQKVSVHAHLRQEVIL